MGKYIIEIPDDMIVSRELPTLAIKAQFGNMRQFALDTGLKLMPYDWVKQGEEIKVGDEVRSRIDRSKICVVTNIMKVGENTQFNCLRNDGKTDWFSSTKNFEKTGRHFPEIAELLKKMEGE